MYANIICNLYWVSRFFFIKSKPTFCYLNLPVGKPRIKWLFSTVGKITLITAGFRGKSNDWGKNCSTTPVNDFLQNGDQFLAS